MNHERCPPCIVLTGMHRSATSAAAAVLQSAGLHIGNRLFGPNEGNPRGYFEDADFVLLHETALKGLGLSKEGWVAGLRCEFREPLRAKARQLIETRRRQGQPWGWKDPRTVLFLDEWAALLPEAHYVFLFREPWAVLDSLFRRRNPGDEVFETSPELAAEVYVHYARAMLAFARKAPNRVVFLSAADVLARPREWISALRQEWSLSLNEPDTHVVDPEGMQQSGGDYRRLLLSHYFPETISAYRDLQAAAGKAQPPARDVPDGEFRKWALQDWVALRRTERLLKQATRQNETLRQEAASLVKDREEWRQRAQEWETKYARFRHLVANSIFWRARRTILRALQRIGIRAHIGDDA